jgi:hypothetical protein
VNAFTEAVNVACEALNEDVKAFTDAVKLAYELLKLLVNAFTDAVKAFIEPVNESNELVNVKPVLPVTFRFPLSVI